MAAVVVPRIVKVEAVVGEIEGQNALVLVKVEDGFVIFIGVPEVAHRRERAVEIGLCEIVQRVTLLRIDEVMGDHHVDQRALRGDAFPAEAGKDGLEVIAYLGDGRVLDGGAMLEPLGFVLVEDDD